MESDCLMLTVLCRANRLSLLSLPTSSSHTRSRMVLLTHHTSNLLVRFIRISRPVVSHNSQHSIPRRDTPRNHSRPEHPVSLSRLTELLLHISHHRSNLSRNPLRIIPLRKPLLDILRGPVVYQQHRVSHNDPVLVLRRSTPTSCSKCTWATRSRHHLER